MSLRLINRDRDIHVLQYLSTSTIIACVHCLLSLLLQYNFLYHICILFLDNVSINNSSRTAQDNYWKSLIEKKSDFDKLCKWLINILIEYSNIEICCFEDKQSIRISQIWIKRDLWNETKELELNDYVDNYLKATHELETSESVHWIYLIHWTCIHMKAKHSSWSQSTSSLSVNWEKETH